MFGRKDKAQPNVSREDYIIHMYVERIRLSCRGGVFLLDSQLLLKDQVAAMARRAFAQIHLM